MKKVDESEVPEEVRSVPASDTEGNGFLQPGLDVAASSIMDDDGVIFTRVKGEYFVEDED